MAQITLREKQLIIVKYSLRLMQMATAANNGSWRQPDLEILNALTALIEKEVETFQQKRTHTNGESKD